MMLQVFSVFDNASKAFLPPFFVRSKGEAIRSFTDAVSDPQHQFAKHAADYILFELGSFNDSDGMFAGVTPTRVLLGVEVAGQSG